MNYKRANLFTNILEITSKPFRNLGRTGRAEYLTIVFLYIAAFAIACLILLQIFSFDIRSKYFSVAAQTITTIIFVRFQIRRLHDLNLNGYWSCIYIISSVISTISPYLSIVTGFIYGIVISVLPGTNGDNKYGDKPSNPSEYKILIATFVMLFSLLFTPLIINRLSLSDGLQIKEMLNNKISLEEAISKK